MPELRIPRMIPLTEAIPGTPIPDRKRVEQKRNRREAQRAANPNPETAPEPREPVCARVHPATEGGRYYITATLGWRIDPDTSTYRTKPATSYTVVDDAYGKIMGIWEPNPTQGSARCLKLAIAFCDEKNAAEEKWLAEEWHGTLGGYTNHRCRCPECTSANTRHKRGYLPAWRKQRALDSNGQTA